jgi:thiamine pyrophosphokinase
MVALILADGDTPTRAELDRGWPWWADDIEMVIAADGGARHAVVLEVDIDLWVGDGDSLGEVGIAALAAAGVTIERSPTDKDETDTELAIRAALREGCDGVIIVGALGGPRIDHALANVNLLTMRDLAGARGIIYTSHSRITVVRGSDPGHDTLEWHDLTGSPGDLVSMLPLGREVDGVTTSGLQYPLADEPLREGSSRGVSNVVTSPGARVAVRHGSLLVVESPATLLP